MKLSISVRSHLNKLVFIGLVFGLQACGGGGGAAPNAAPVFTSAATISVAENNTATGYTAAATDAENNTVTFSLTGGADQSRLSIDGTSGVLSFQNAEDFEAAADSDTNNSYVVAISASDGTNTVSQTVTVTVTDVNEAPVFTSTATASVAENNTVSGYTATVDDPENNTITYSVTGGTDQSQFSIDSASGALSFQAVTDFEAPSDSDTNNTYVVEVTAADGPNSVIQSVTVTVINVSEVTGYYDTGSISVSGTGNLQGIVNGNRLMFYSATSKLLYDATLTLTGTDYTANLTIYTSGLSPVSATATGSFIDESSITGVVSGGGVAVDGTFTLSFANTNNDLSALTKVTLPVVPGWGFFSSIALDGIVFDAEGQITQFVDLFTSFGTNTYLDSCTASTGQSIQPIDGTRLYIMSFILSNCDNTTVNGTYTGLATTYVDTNPDDRFLMFAANANSLVSIYDFAEK